jgi:transcription-repair coupling factor (superfamily II helicase)
MAMKTRNLPGIEWTEIEGGPNCGEMITVSNSLTNGLRIEIFNDDIDDIGLFHIQDATTAVQIAQVLVEYAQRIANPPQPASQQRPRVANLTSISAAPTGRTVTSMDAETDNGGP